MASYVVVYDARRWVRSDSTDTTFLLPVVAGGSGANLSGTGGSNQVVQQTSVGGAFTVGQLSSSALSDVSNLVTTNTVQTIGPSAAKTFADNLTVLSNQDAGTVMTVQNSNNTTAAVAQSNITNNLGAFARICHAGARTVARYGITLGGWAEVFVAAAINGLVMGTQGATPVVIGTNNVERMRIDGSGNVTVQSPSQYAYATGAFTVADGKYIVIGEEWDVTGTQECAIVGSSYVRIV